MWEISGKRWEKMDLDVPLGLLGSMVNNWLKYHLLINGVFRVITH